jgi:AraC-like DNA-binding protein
MKQTIESHNFKSGLPVQFEIIDLKDLYKSHKADLTSAHRTNFYQIIWFQHGKGVHTIDFQELTAEAGSMVFLTRGMVQKFDESQPLEGITILFTSDFYCRTNADVQHLNSSILFNDLLGNFHVSVGEIKTTFEAVVNLMRVELAMGKDEYQEAYLQNLLHNFLLLAERQKKTQDFVELKKDANLDYVMWFKEALNEGFKEHKTVSYYANELNITEKRLNQATSTVLGQSPKQIINHRVMLEAKRLIGHTHNNIKEVAYFLGFNEPTNFIKYFRQHAGITPVEFREQQAIA